MLFDVLAIICSVLECVFMYITLNYTAKFIFLEKTLDRNKYKSFYVCSILIIVACTVFFMDIAQIVMIFLSGLSFALAREKNRFHGFVHVVLGVGVINGLFVPFVTVPQLFNEISDKQNIIYRLVLYILLYIGVFVFEILGKKWRERFVEESENRHLRIWEYLIISIIFILMTIIANGLAQIWIAQDNGENIIDVVRYMIMGMIIMAEVLTIMIIVLIVQGNKRNYYYNEALKNEEMAENRRKSVEKMSLQMIRALANTIDAKDSYTNGHSTRVAKYSVMIAKKLGYEGNKLELLEYTALLHDIGKIGIPNEIINKPSRLTDEEYDIIKTHPGIGGKILEEITEIPDIAIGARYHHERFDGKGYPDKLSGEEIPEIARIIGVADAYDAMTSNRSYRDLLPQQVVRGEIEKGKNTQFDPAIADVMLSLIDEDISYTMHE